MRKLKVGKVSKSPVTQQSSETTSDLPDKKVCSYETKLYSLSRFSLSYGGQHSLVDCLRGCEGATRAKVPLGSQVPCYRLLAWLMHSDLQLLRLCSHLISLGGCRHVVLGHGCTLEGRFYPIPHFIPRAIVPWPICSSGGYSLHWRIICV